MMRSPSYPKQWPLAELSGLIGGMVLWYLVHEIGVYFSDFNCGHPWILPASHVLGFAGVLFCGFISYRSFQSHRSNQGRAFMASAIGVAAAALFSLVILWQTVATFIYTGCER